MGPAAAAAKRWLYKRYMHTQHTQHPKRGILLMAPHGWPPHIADVVVVANVAAAVIWPFLLYGYSAVCFSTIPDPTSYCVC